MLPFSEVGFLGSESPNARSVSNLSPSEMFTGMGHLRPYDYDVSVAEDVLFRASESTFCSAPAPFSSWPIRR